VTGARTILVGIYSRVAAWNIPASCVDRLRAEFPDHQFLHARSDAEALAKIPAAQIAFMADIRPEQLAAARQLEWIHSPAAGVGNMLFPALIDSAVTMSNSRGNSADTIAEHVLAVTLVLFRKLTMVVHSQATATWAQDAVLADPPLRTIAGSAVLIVGLGSIGMATARRMSALGATVTGIRRHPDRSRPEFVQQVAPSEALMDLLPGADVVVLAAPQTPLTRHVIGRRELAAMRRGAILVNVSRGALIDEAALAAALTAPPGERTIGAAALDVFEHEPLPLDSPLWRIPDVLVTPHIAGFRPDHWEAVTALFADNLRRFESGQPLLNVVDKREGY
jgi:phosphoglycerate dehydrogenase-like enzyme